MSEYLDKAASEERPRTTEKEWACIMVASALVLVLAGAVVFVVYSVCTRLFDL